MNIKEALNRVVNQLDLNTEEMQDVMREIMTGQCTDAQIGAFLMGMRMKSETIDEIVGAVSVMRELASHVHLQTLDHVVDVVGTGGDGANIFNVSTAASFVVAAAGGKVAKHGNRAVSGKSGSADLLEAAGIYLSLTPVQVARCIESVGVGFMFAQVHHSAMKYAAVPRRELGLRTLFNMLGPLTNPAGVTRQLTGTFDATWCRPMAETLRELGSTHVWLIHGSDGTDELAISGDSFVVEMKDGQIREFTITPEDAGLPRHDFAQIVGGDAAHNAAAARAILDGAQNAYRDAVILNAAAALLVAGRVTDLREGAALATHSLDSGAAKAKLEALAAIVPL